MYKLPNGKIVYEEDIQCVHDPVDGKGGIFIGNLQAAENLNTLKKNGIKAVLTTCKGTFLNHSKSEVPFQLYIPGVDHESFDMSKYFAQGIKFIEDAAESTNILVHCLGGVSRSVTITIVYFIKCWGMTYEEAYSKIKARRRIIHPNDSFIEQMKNFEMTLRRNGEFLESKKKISSYETRSTYTPVKRQQTREVLRGYEGNKYGQTSPKKKSFESPYKHSQSGFQSPQKANMRASQCYSKYSRLAPHHSGYGPKQNESVKNPEFYRSIVQDLKEDRKQRLLNPSERVGQYSPDRSQMQMQYSRPKSTIGNLKRLSSMNADIDRQYPRDDMRSSQFLGNYAAESRTRGRASEYVPLHSIENNTKEYTVDNIDEKIAEIRRKYQDISVRPSQNEQTKPSTAYEGNRYVANRSISGANENRAGDLMDLRMRKICSDMSSQQREIGIIRPNNSGKNIDDFSVNCHVNVPQMGNRLKRMQSYQV